MGGPQVRACLECGGGVVTVDVDRDAVELAIEAAWSGDCADWPNAALLLAVRVERLMADVNAVTAELEQLRGIAEERVRLWAEVELLKQRLQEAYARIARQRAVAGRAAAIRDGKDPLFAGLIGRRVARYILQAGVSDD